MFAEVKALSTLSRRRQCSRKQMIFENVLVGGQGGSRSSEAKWRVIAKMGMVAFKVNTKP